MHCHTKLVHQMVHTYLLYINICNQPIKMIRVHTLTYQTKEQVNIPEGSSAS